ncbi:hypothetical protein PR002_g214, partial [Phytophthora rubi]
MSLQDFVHNYEMESLQLGITARRDALAARRAAENLKRDKRPGATLVLAGNTREGFHHRLRNIQLLALANALHKSNVPGLVGLDLRYNNLAEHEDSASQDDAENGGDDEEEEARDEREYLLETASSLGRLLQP